MRRFGRTLYTKTLAAGGLMPLEKSTLRLSGYPTVSTYSMKTAQEVTMFVSRGVFKDPPAPLWTRYATGGCVPICAAEITPPNRTVQWVYLIHAHGVNKPKNVAALANNPNDVYVGMVIFDGATSRSVAEYHQDIYFSNLDPNNIIPNENALLIYGNHSKLFISSKAMIAVDRIFAV